MTSKDKGKNTTQNDTTKKDRPDDEDQTDLEDEGHDDLCLVAGTSASGAASGSKKKKKKKSKLSKLLKGKSDIPEAFVHQVIERVKAEGSIPEEDLTVENIRGVLEHLKIMDVVQGKAGLGTNAKDMGEHKVTFFWCALSKLLISFFR
jgi:glycylpeptide N-tetradecanoyltransferase